MQGNNESAARNTESPRNNWTRQLCGRAFSCSRRQCQSRAPAHKHAQPRFRAVSTLIKPYLVRFLGLNHLDVHIAPSVPLEAIAPTFIICHEVRNAKRQASAGRLPNSASLHGDRDRLGGDGFAAGIRQRDHDGNGAAHRSVKRHQNVHLVKRNEPRSQSREHNRSVHSADSGRGRSLGAEDRREGGRRLPIARRRRAFRLEHRTEARAINFDVLAARHGLLRRTCRTRHQAGPVNQNRALAQPVAGGGEDAGLQIRDIDVD